MGRIRSWHKRALLDHGRPRVLRPREDDDGYVRVGFGYVHQLVALAWHGECPPGHEVDHDNRIRNDNRATNLQYLTHADNVAKRVYAT
jgi:hypothetical protein